MKNNKDDLAEECMDNKLTMQAASTAMYDSNGKAIGINLFFIHPTASHI